MLLLAFLFGFLNVDSIPATGTDTLSPDTNVVYVYSRHQLLNINSFGSSIVADDTTLDGFQFYDPAELKDPFYINTGNTGLPVFSTVFNPLVKTGFRIGVNGYDLYLFNDNDVKYYRNKRPYTLVRYNTGTKKEHVLNLVHSRNITRNWNITGQYRKVRSLGYFDRQFSNHSSYLLSTHYKRKNYTLIANTIYNSFRHQENGGLQQDTSLSDLPDPRILDVYLNNADNQYKDFNVNLNHQYSIPLSADSSSKRSALNIVHDLNLNSTRNVYKDSILNKAYYQVFYYDSVLHKDSIQVRSLSNSAGLNYSMKKNSRSVFTGIKAGQESYNIVRRNAGDTTFNQVKIIQENVFELNSWDLSSTYLQYIQGYNRGDNLFRFSVDKHLQKIKLGLEYKMQHYSPTYFQNSFYSNAFRWENHFKKTAVQGVGVNAMVSGIHADASLMRVSNYVYYNASKDPVQDSVSFSVARVSIRYKINTSRIGWLMYGGFQKMGNRNLEAHYPSLYAVSSFYLRAAIFRKALNIEPGIDIKFFTGYYLPGYNPVFHDIYYPGSATTGSNVYADLFMNFRVKAVRVTLKVDNITSPFIGTSYQVLDYPVMPLTIKFGVSWVFHD